MSADPVKRAARDERALWRLIEQMRAGRRVELPSLDRAHLWADAVRAHLSGQPERAEVTMAEAWRGLSGHVYDLLKHRRGALSRLRLDREDRDARLLELTFDLTAQLCGLLTRRPSLLAGAALRPAGAFRAQLAQLLERLLAGLSIDARLRRYLWAQVAAALRALSAPAAEGGAGAQRRADLWWLPAPHAASAAPPASVGPFDADLAERARATPRVSVHPDRRAAEGRLAAYLRPEEVRACVCAHLALGDAWPLQTLICAVRARLWPPTEQVFFSWDERLSLSPSLDELYGEEALGEGAGEDGGEGGGEDGATMALSPWFSPLAGVSLERLHLELDEEGVRAEHLSWAQRRTALVEGIIDAITPLQRRICAGEARLELHKPTQLAHALSLRGAPVRREAVYAARSALDGAITATCQREELSALERQALIETLYNTLAARLEELENEPDA